MAGHGWHDLPQFTYVRVLTFSAIEAAELNEDEGFLTVNAANIGVLSSVTCDFSVDEREIPSS
jgi:hypothetical protein